ncbi:MAG: efflux transporter outer membrane subunit, partial [Burkholderiaceae bacterium]
MDIKRRLAACAVLSTICAMLLSGCASGPDFRPPQPDAPAQWNALDDAQPHTGNAPSSRLVREPFDGRRWWSVFHDPVLDGLIGDAKKQNLTLQIAASRIRQARIQRAATASGLLPSVSANAAGARTKFSENGASAALGGGGRGSAASAPANTFQVGFDALWELDLWGKTRRAVEAADANTAAAVENRHDALVSLTAEIARTWFALLGARAQLRVAQDNLATQRRILSLVQSQRQAGLVAESDVLQAQTAIDATEASLPPLEQETERDANALALLLAQPPGALRERLAGHDALPDLPPQVPVGLPGDLLRRRPDIRRSESQLHVATARIGVAVAQLFPSVRLGAVGGLQASRLADLSDWASRFFLFG